MPGDVAVRARGRAAVGWLEAGERGWARLARRRAVKRGLDTALVLLFVILLLPGCVVVALLIRLCDGGPALFQQERVGLNGRPFRMWKFRTMAVDLEGGATTAVDDARVTRLGHSLRRFHLDELPQAWNVLLGQMSLVGPRPEQTALAAAYRTVLPDYDLRHLVRPGMTGLAQVRAPYAADLAATRVKLAHDLDYVRTGTLGGDLAILVKTLEIVWTGKGAR